MSKYRRELEELWESLKRGDASSGALAAAISGKLEKQSERKSELAIGKNSVQHQILG